MIHRIPALALAAAGALHIALAVPASAAGPVGMNGTSTNGLTYNGLHPNGAGMHHAPSEAVHRFSATAPFDFKAVEALAIELPEAAAPVIVAMPVRPNCVPWPDCSYVD